MRFFLEIWHVREILFQNLTRCKIYNSQFNALLNFQIKIWCVVKFLNQNLTPCFSFWNLTRCKIFISKSCFLYPSLRFSMKFYQNVSNIREKPAGKWQRPGLKKIPVCGMCLSHIWYYLFGYCARYGKWILHACDDSIICTTNWFLQISWSSETG